MQIIEEAVEPTWTVRLQGRLLRSIAVAIVAAILVLACSPGDGAQRVRIGVGPWVGFGPIYLAEQAGHFAAENLDVEIITLTGLAERNAALASGRIDALAAPVDYFVLAAGNGVDTRVVMAIDESYGGDGIVSKPDLEGLAALRGKRVAVQQGLPGDFFLRTLLRESGIAPDELELIDMETAQAGAAFIAGDVDAAVVWEPWLTRAREEGGGKILASTRTERDLIVDALAFNEEFVSEHPEAVSATIRAILRAIDDVAASPVSTSEVMAPHFDLDPEKYRVIVEGLRFCNLERNREYFGVGRDEVPIHRVARFALNVWKDAGRIRVDTFDPASIVSAEHL